MGFGHGKGSVLPMMSGIVSAAAPESQVQLLAETSLSAPAGRPALQYEQADGGSPAEPLPGGAAAAPSAHQPPRAARERDHERRVLGDRCGHGNRCAERANLGTGRRRARHCLVRKLGDWRNYRRRDPAQPVARRPRRRGHPPGDAGRRR